MGSVTLKWASVWTLLMATLCITSLAVADPPDSTETKLPENYISFGLGYSFGQANTPFSAEAASDLTDSHGNEPLIALTAVLGKSKPFRSDVTLALASFGRVVNLVDEAETDTTAASDVRRSILADLILRRRFFPSKNKSLYTSFNVGFLFDAQANEHQEIVPDASGYLMAGLSYLTDVGHNSSLNMDLLFGQSEVMTNLDLLDGRWTWQYTRIRPRIRFHLDKRDELSKSRFFDDIVFGVWADMGLDKAFGDTYVLFISKGVALYGM